MACGMGGGVGRCDKSYASVFACVRSLKTNPPVVLNTCGSPFTHLAPEISDKNTTTQLAHRLGNMLHVSAPLSGLVIHRWRVLLMNTNISRMSFLHIVMEYSQH